VAFTELFKVASRLIARLSTVSFPGSRTEAVGNAYFKEFVTISLIIRDIGTAVSISKNISLVFTLKSIESGFKEYELHN
jgi:hypothetical protein